ncbi:MAG: AAA family ATPase [Betaproteobacteria bacterium]|nr:AAA family ATPase [Betaproteobacteria bacterium]
MASRSGAQLACSYLARAVLASWLRESTLFRRSLVNLIPSRRLEADDHASSPAELRVVYDVDGLEIIYTATVFCVTNEKNQDEVSRADEVWSVPGINGRRRRIGVPTYLLADIAGDRSFGSSWSGNSRREHFVSWLKKRKVVPETMAALTQIIGFILRLKYYSASQFTNPGAAPVSIEVESEAKRRVGISITGHKRLLFDIYQEHLQKTRTYAEFISLVGPDGIGLIDGLDFEEIKTSSSSYTVRTGGTVVQKEKTNLLVVPQIKISGNTLSPSQLSEGTFKTLALIFCLVTDSSTLLMIEEPEVCVHHGLLSSIVELIRVYSSEKQILVSTHSDSVLDKVDLENVFRVSRARESGTLVSSIRGNMSAREIAALRNYLENEGSLGEYWKHGDLETA